MLVAAYAAMAAAAPTPVASTTLSLVVARSVRQTDQVPAPCGPDGSCGDFHYTSSFERARTLAGAPLPRNFTARLKLHTPFVSPYTLALIVERQPDGSLTVLRRAGFNGMTGVACFEARDEAPVDWRPVSSAILAGEQPLCLFQQSEIDPKAPRR